MFSVSVGIIAGFFHVGGYWLYARGIFKEAIQPNTASWSIWAFGALLEAATYIALTGDWVKDIVPVACAISAISIFIFCLIRGSFSRPSSFDRFIILLDNSALLVWWLSQSASYANFLLVATAVISFVPIIRDTFVDPTSEDSRPWYLWSIAYLLLTVVVLLRWEKREELLYPVAFLLLHLFIAVLASDIRPHTYRALRLVHRTRQWWGE